jgi:hypothetical protein
MAKRVLFFFFFFALLIQPLHPVLAQKRLLLPVHIHGNSNIYEPCSTLENLKEQLRKTSVENGLCSYGEVTVVSSEDGSDMENGSETVPGEDDTDANTDSDSDDDADRGNDALTPSEQ